MTEAVLRFPFRFPFPFSVSPSPITVYRSSTRPPIGCWRREMEIRIGFLGTNRSNPLDYSGLPKSTQIYSGPLFSTLFSRPQKGRQKEVLGGDFGSQNGTKTDPNSKKDSRKSIKMVTSVLSSISGRCRSGKWRPRTPLNPLKLLVFLYQNENPLF